MTREEAIHHIMDVITENNSIAPNMVTFDLEKQALYMAIEALKQPEQKGKWIPLETRPMDVDERKEWSEKLGYELEDYEAVIYTGPLPDDGQNVLICLRNGDIRMDTFEEDDCGCYFDEWGEMDGVVAWMPLPKPWEGEKWQ